MFLSIIVPVYNVENYLAKCLDSLLNQNISTNEYEILVINDGATDQSPVIAASYAKQYTHIKLIHQENQGLGAARNTGIHHAKGKYIQFVDSDDYLEPNVLSYLVQKMEQEKLDILRFNFQNVNEDGKVIFPNKTIQFVDYSDNVCDGVSFLSECLGYACYAWQFMLKASLVEDADNCFKEGLYFEDMEWTPRLLIQANRVTSVDKVVYNYLLREGSITKSVSKEKKRKWVNDKMLVIENLIRSRKEAYCKDWYNGMIALAVSSIITYVSLNFNQDSKLYLNRLKKMKVYPLRIRRTDLKTKLRLMLINFSPLIYAWLISRKN